MKSGKDILMLKVKSFLIYFSIFLKKMPDPIALLETIRNIAGNMLLDKERTGLGKLLFGRQFAVGVNGGRR